MNNNTYQWLQEKVNELVFLINSQTQLSDTLNLETEVSKELKRFAQVVSEETFKVLIIGAFSSGKSSFINALLGERILPVKRLPSTATICEIKYGEHKKCVLFPKSTGYKHKKGQEIYYEPFEVSIEELNDYVLIDHNNFSEDDKKISTPFEKMILYWPLGICKDGVEIIDSPGLNDPDSNDKITLEYLNNADAVIYCMPSTQAYTDLDRKTLEDLNNNGYKSILFILTHIDQIESHELDEFKIINKNQLSRYTALGENGVIFTNTLDALKGKIENNQELLTKSNFPILETELENYLVEQKGRARLFLGERKINVNNNALSDYINTRLNYNSKKKGDLISILEKQKHILENAKNKRDIILRAIDFGIQKITNDSGDLGRKFMYNLNDKIATWVTDFTPKSKISINPLSIKSSINAYVSEYLEYLKSTLKKESNDWSKNSLEPLINNGIKEIRDSTIGLKQNYDKLLESFDLEMDFGSFQETKEKIEPNPIAQAGSFLYGLVTHDYIGAGLGFTFGFKGLITSIATQISVGIVLGIVSLFTPVGLPVFILGALSAGLLSGGIQYNLIPNKVKKSIIEKLNAEFAKNEVREKIINDIKANVNKALQIIITETGSEFDNDILPKERAMKEAHESFEKNDEELKQENEMLLTILKQNDDLGVQIKKYSSSLNYINNMEG